jgi:DNA-binding SARP family transcriptional activator
MFKENIDFTKSLDVVPDEYFSWVSKKWNIFQEEYTRIEEESRNALEHFKSTTSTRPEFAKFATKHIYSRIIFAMYNNKEYRNNIIDLIRPVNGVYDTPYSFAKPNNEMLPVQKNQSKVIMGFLGAEKVHGHIHIFKNTRIHCG